MHADRETDKEAGRQTDLMQPPVPFWTRGKSPQARGQVPETHVTVLRLSGEVRQKKTSQVMRFAMQAICVKKTDGPVYVTDL